MDQLIAYFNMGGYAGFVWPSYGVAVVVMAGLFVAVWRGLRHEERVLAQLQMATGGRRHRGRRAAARPPETEAGGAAMAPVSATPDNGGTA